MTPRTAALAASLIVALLTTGPAASGASGVSAASTGPGATATAAAAVQPGESRTSSYAAGTCTTVKLSDTSPIRSRSGKKLGTAQMFAASRGEDLGFCVRIEPVKALRKITTQALLPNKTYYPGGDLSSSGLIGGSGLWRFPFLVTGSVFGPGSSMKATAKIVVPGGPSGKTKLEGTLS